MTRPASCTSLPSSSPPMWAKCAVTSMLGRSRAQSTVRTAAAAAATTAITTAPTLFDVRSSNIPAAGERLFLPEELPRIALEVADHLAQVGVELLADQERAGRAL